SLASGPSGDVGEYFDPGKGKPPMLIQTESIYNGWFSLFMLNGAPLKYVVSDGKILFGGPVDLSDSRFASSNSSTASTLRFDFPSRDEFRSEGGSNSYWHVAAPQSAVYGWFLDPAFPPAQSTGFLSQVAICTQYPYVAKESVLGSMSSTPQNTSMPAAQPLYSSKVSEGASAPTPAQLLLGGSNYYFAGNYNIGSGPCLTEFPVASDQSRTITVNRANYDGNFSGDSNSPLQPPFRLNSPLYSGGPAFAFSPSIAASGIKLSATYLEGAAWDSAMAFYSTSSKNGGSNLSCSDLAAGGGAASGYFPLPASLALLANSNAGLSLTINSSLLSAGGLSVQLCGTKNGMRISKPFRIDGGSFNLPGLMVVPFGPSLNVAGATGNIVVDSQNNLYYPDINGWAIQKIDPLGTQATIVSGFNGTFTDGPPGVATFIQPQFLAIDGNDNIYVADQLKIRKIVLGTNYVTTVGTMGAQGTVRGIAADSSGNVYFVLDDTAGSAYEIQKMSPGGTVTVLAGSATPGNADGTGAAAGFNLPADLAVDTAGNLYVADTGNFKIRKITPAGVVTTLAGNGTNGYQDGNGTGAVFSMYSSYPGWPYAHMSMDSSNNIYLNDNSVSYTGPSTIRKINTSTGDVSTYCGATASPSANQGPCSVVGINANFGLGVDHTGKVFFANGSMLMQIK
ncbi:MAG: hypothetical protein ACXVA9_11005, partial [Bdellovibrionales bacterium]